MCYLGTCGVRMYGPWLWKRTIRVSDCIVSRGVKGVDEKSRPLRMCERTKHYRRAARRSGCGLLYDGVAAIAAVAATRPQLRVTMMRSCAPASTQCHLPACYNPTHRNSSLRMEWTVIALPVLAPSLDCSRLKYAAP